MRWSLRSSHRDLGSLVRIDGNDGIADIAVDGAGHVAISGTLGGPLDGGPAQTNVDALVAGLDAATGNVRWRKVYATAGDDRAFALTSGRNGDVYACVGLGGAFDFGVPVIGAASPASVLVRIAP